MNPSPRRSHAFSSKTFALLFSAALCLSACAGKPADEGRRYELKGKVISVDSAKGEVKVEHGDIRDFMPSMTMDFPVRDAEALKVLEPGDGVQATLVVTDDAYWLEGVAVTKTIQRAGTPGNDIVTTFDGSSPPAAGAHEPKPGDEMPDVKLVNQDGRPFNTRQLKGRALVVTFIYTRCPMPDQCPLMSANFAQLNAALVADAELRKKARLLSVTLDPEFDKPEVLRSYAATYAGGKFDNWDFATGDPADVRRFAEFFGLIYKAEGGQVTHSLRTAVVGADGKLLKIYRGNEWKPEEVLGELKSLPAS
jgi:protein SCO1/2